ncbi:hypothetical protein [Streptomyces parvus]|uniref:hypothetical protein n=1 Tax=Streptomyces parvus TaxID=66428 RepID=UPI003405DEC2
MSSDTDLPKELLDGLSREGVEQARAAMVPRGGPPDAEGRAQRGGWVRGVCNITQIAPRERDAAASTAEALPLYEHMLNGAFHGVMAHHWLPNCTAAVAYTMRQGLI